MIGMGSSSRPVWDKKDGDEADEYFVQIIEKWRIAMGDLTDFFLCGHSYGAYLTGTYAVKYPQHIRKLVLISPLGLKVRPKDFDISKQKFNGGEHPWWARAFLRSLWGSVTPFSLFRV